MTAPTQSLGERVTLKLLQGDNRDHLRQMISNGEFVHSVVCDPPYGLTSIVKRFGGKDAAPAKHGTDGAIARASRGFMGKLWDGTGIERDPEFWRLMHDVLLPGGYCVAFSGSRTGHWQAVAMEQAGFIMHPMIGWVTNQGFPKAVSASKQIAKSGSAEAQQWEGWAYGTQSLKPALEPIYVAQRPFSEKNGALNILKHGVGALNIDGCRVPTQENLNGGAYAKNPTARKQMWGDKAGQEWKRGGAGDYKQPSGGRHPANLLHDGSDEVVALFPDTAGGRSAPRNSARYFNSFPAIISHPKANKADRAGSPHPTVKPIGLMQHLVRLVTPPNGTVLDPFAGSGTTGEAAALEGFDCILMEAEPTYFEDLKRRFGSGQRCLFEGSET